MNLKEAAHDWARTLIGRHIGRNTRRYTAATYVGVAGHTMLGAMAYLGPQEGNVVEVGEQYSLVKVSPNKFLIVLNTLLTQPLIVSEKVRVAGYQLRRFDGTLADGMDDAADANGILSCVSSGAQTQFPVKWPGRYLGINEKFEASYPEIRNQHLQVLIKQLEDMPLDGGIRLAVNCLVDAGGNGLDFVDPPLEKSATMHPAVRVNVATRKFTGTVEIFYKCIGDLYGIRLRGQGSSETDTVIDDIGVDELGEALQDAIDDGRWRLAHVTVLRRAKATASVSV